MRVVPRNDSQSWVFLEPVRNIFLESTIQIEERRFSAIDSTLPIHNEFHIDLCEDMGQLVQAYFRRFYIQGLDKPWQAFSGGWRTPSLSKYFGIGMSFASNNKRVAWIEQIKDEKLWLLACRPKFRGGRLSLHVGQGLSSEKF